MPLSEILLITPPFTQINTPYPATCYLKGFLNTRGISATQLDLSLEVFLRIFSREGLTQVFDQVEFANDALSENAFRIYTLKEGYLSTIDFVIDFLQSQRSTLAHRIIHPGFLPMASRFDYLDMIDEAFGIMSLVDKAKYLATLYLEDLADFIRETVDPHFGFSRYAERIASSLTNFNRMQEAMQEPEYLTITFLKEIVSRRIQDLLPSLVAITVPFPGNLLSALKCGQVVKSRFPQIPVALGGGYCNTELRSLKDPGVFQYVDYIILDDGKMPLLCLLEYVEGRREVKNLKRTYLLKGESVLFSNGASERDIPQRETGTPDYSDLHLAKYLSVLEIANPMHRLWSDGRWNKLTMAHGCYWGKCTFCDVTLDYIARYEPVTADLLCDRIQTLIRQTGERGFHFVDEAAPPAMMRELALELLRRNLNITWWANIRFEKTFDSDLCRLLAASGCVAVSGGLEVASDRLLKMIRKGVTIDQVTRVTHAFTDAGIMVHAYLMYGFPTQTEQETIDSLEIVRQLFEQDVIQSGFWHLFSMTAHSPVGKNPELFGVEKTGPAFEGFAENDLDHRDPSGALHEKYSEGLKKSLFNYMNGIGLDEPLGSWFDFRVPETTIAPDRIRSILSTKEKNQPADHARLCWIGGEPSTAESKGRKVVLRLINPEDEMWIRMSPEEYHWFMDMFPEFNVRSQSLCTFGRLKASYENTLSGKVNFLMESNLWKVLRKNGLLVI